ncbi:hypothetical protein [Methylotenera sp.]|uniref:hypothetical protein n=1 Tax=Methylotenera sp. TaxID=2051956 RepID=UPI0024871E8C|nr:hypothetical protein [Methylotenera sp.]MDI1361513.1 hypothetical protein [Methylotenera sp.]
MSNVLSSISELYSQHSNLEPLRLRQIAIEKEISLLHKELEEITQHITYITGLGAGKRKFENQAKAMLETVAIWILCDQQKEMSEKDIIKSFLQDKMKKLGNDKYKVNASELDKYRKRLARYREKSGLN